MVMSPWHLFGAHRLRRWFGSSRSPAAAEGAAGASSRPWWVRRRFALPLIAACTLLALALNEFTHTHLEKAPQGDVSLPVVGHSPPDATAQTHEQTLASMREALWVNHWVAMTLTLLGALALALYVRDARQRDLDSARQQEAVDSQVNERTAELQQLAGHLLSARE
jgi:hypothetical protein